MPGEHFVLRDLHFYKEAREADAKARQEHLSQREERRQEGTLRRAPGKKHLMPSSATRPLAEKKKKITFVKVTKALTSVPSSPSTSSSASGSSGYASEGFYSFLRPDLSNSGTTPSEPEPEPIASGATNESKKIVVDMSVDLRVGFKERHRKRLYEAIDMVLSHAKKACPKMAWEGTEREAPTTPAPQPDAMEPSSVPAAEEETGPAPRGALMAPLLLRKFRTKMTLLRLFILLAGKKWRIF